MAQIYYIIKNNQLWTTSM